MNFRKIDGIVLALVIGLILSSSLAGSPPEKYKIPSLNEIEEQIQNLVNKERSDRGLPLLLEDPLLEKVAKSHSLKMAVERELSHIFPAYPSLEIRLSEAGLYFIGFGENVAFSETYVARIIHEELMNSPEHRKNIIDPTYTHFGINVVKAGSNYFVTQDFIRIFEPLSPEEVENRLEDMLADWFKKRQGHEPVVFSEMKSSLRDLGVSKLKGMNLRYFINTAPQKWGRFRLLSLLSPEIGRIVEAVKREAGKVAVRGISVGATVGRNAQYRGGTYSVAILLFGSPYRRLSQNELRKRVLEPIEELRRINNLIPLTLDSKLNRQALNLANISYHTPNFKNANPAGYKVNYLTCYQTGDLGIIPDGVGLLDEKMRYLGIGVFYPLQYKLMGNFFVVSLLLKK